MTKTNIRQLQVVHNISKGMSTRKAFLEAGYSESSANQSSRLMKTGSMQEIVQTLGTKLEERGVNVEYIAGKIAEWFEAKKVVHGQEVPDYDTQIKAYEKTKELLKEDIGKTPGKTTLTLEEWMDAD